MKYTHETQRTLDALIEVVNSAAERGDLSEVVEDMTSEIYSGTLSDLFLDDDAEAPVNTTGAIVKAFFDYLLEVDTQAFIMKHSVTRKPDIPTETPIDVLIEDMRNLADYLERRGGDF